MNKYDRLKADLEQTGQGRMKCFGNSMLPRLPNPSLCEYVSQQQYEVGDIVFSKVKGRFIDAHQITACDGDRYLISNNHGHDNGWTRAVFGKVVKAIDHLGRERVFD